jgi:hypothetical protein
MKTIHVHIHPHHLLHPHLNFKIHNLIINETYYNMRRIYNSESYDFYKLGNFQ